MKLFLSSDRLSNSWIMIGFLTLSIRFVQGWIYWGGGSRRFIYAPAKLDPLASTWLANKIQAAMPGAILGTQHILSFMLTHFYLLYPAIILFSLVELFSGLGLIFGFMTRFSGFITALLSISLMILFGWQGSTCLDEWTMAVSNLAMGLTLAVAGGPVYSIDALLLRVEPRLHHRRWFLAMASGPLTTASLKLITLLFAIFTIVFTLTTYNYYRGAIFSRYHAGPVSPTQHHIALTKGKIFANGALHFTGYVDAGSPDVPTFIMKIELRDSRNRVAEVWDGSRLSGMKSNQIQNEYAYNQFAIGKYGLLASLGARAQITLTPLPSTHLAPGNYELEIDLVDGTQATMPLTRE